MITAVRFYFRIQSIPKVRGLIPTTTRSIKDIISYFIISASYYAGFKIYKTP